MNAIDIRAQRDLLQGNAIWLYGIIDAQGQDSIRALDVADALRRLMTPTVTLRINSGGGSAYEGWAIFNLLRADGRPIIAYVDGLAASMASVICCAASEVIIAANAQIVVHNPFAHLTGTADEFAKASDDLRKVENDIVAVYRAKTKLPEAEVRRLMREESTLTAEQAKSLGFVNTISTPLQIAACVAPRMSLTAYLAPASINMSTPTPPPAPAPAVPIDAEAIRAQATMAERTRAAAIRAEVRRAGLSPDFGEGLVTSGLSIEDARARIIDNWADLQNASEGNGNGFPRVPGNGGESSFANPQFLGRSITDAIYARMSGKPPTGAAVELMGASLLDLGRLHLEARGERGPWQHNRRALVERIMAGDGGQHTTSDFPGLLMGAGQRFLADAFVAAQSALKPLCRQRDVQDFRPVAELQLGESPRLLEVVEGAEFTHATIGEGSQSYTLGTYGRIFGLTGQAITNDDLGAFSDAAAMMGRGAAATEAAALAALLLANAGHGVIMSDGVALYNETAHKNLVTPGTALSVTTLGQAREKMRTQLGIDGVEVLGIAPRFLVTGPALETEAEKTLTAITATRTADANPFAQLSLAIEARLSGYAFRLFADPATMPTFVLAYLQGTGRAPIVEQRQGWSTWSIEYRARHHFAVAATEWRASVMNEGAAPS